MKAGKHIIIIDDLVQTGGTLFSCKEVLLEAGALSVDCYVTHPVFPNNCWTEFLEGGKKSGFGTFWITDTIPTIANEIDGKGPFIKLCIADHLATFL